MAGGNGKVLKEGPVFEAGSGNPAAAWRVLVLMLDCPPVPPGWESARWYRALLHKKRLAMSQYVNGRSIQQHTVALSDGGTLSVTLLHGTGADAGRRCIHRVTTDSAGRLRSDIVYFYDRTVKDAEVEADFSLLTRHGLMSMSQLHHTESMLNRGHRTPRRG